MTEVRRRHPEWLKVRAPAGAGFFATRAIVRTHRLHTVCEEARCPNIGECWGHGTATFMLLGDRCTRNCGFCAVAHGRGAPPDPAEPRRVAEAARALGLQHVVVTSVNRDDLPDGGAGHFAATAVALRDVVPTCRVEVLVPDFQGAQSAVDVVVDAPIDIFNHNTETVPRLYGVVRAGARYQRSLSVLRRAKDHRPALLTKSGLMLGLGEERDEIVAVLRDLRAAGCDILTLGQYLQPSPTHLPVTRYVAPAEFGDLRAAALALGFRHVEAGPLVRSSYHAWAHVPDGPRPGASAA
jgi:lipoic acid synthetase